jgi:hypothetical protein
MGVYMNYGNAAVKPPEDEHRPPGWQPVVCPSPRIINIDRSFTFGELLAFARCQSMDSRIDNKLREMKFDGPQREKCEWWIARKNWRPPDGASWVPGGPEHLLAFLAQAEALDGVSEEEIAGVIVAPGREIRVTFEPRPTFAHSQDPNNPGIQVPVKEFLDPENCVLMAMITGNLRMVSLTHASFPSEWKQLLVRSVK